VSDPSPSVALGAVAFLERGAIASSVEVTTLSPSDPRPLLSGLYDVVRRDPARLTASLDLLAAVARQATLVQVLTAATTPPDQIADALLRALP
jgi:hypothetical protein